MKLIIQVVFTLILIMPTKSSFSDDSINFVVLPEPYNCHHIGVDFKVSQNSTLGIIATNSCNSNRPTFGKPVSGVTSNFSRIFIPWRYSFQGAFKNSFFIQPMIGTENYKFKSTAGSNVDVKFIDVSLHGGYQWFFNNGLNVSLLFGANLLAKSEENKSIASNETSEVVSFFDDNTKSNIHTGFGAIFGWAF